MPLDAGELDSRIQKLRKSLKGFSRNPTVEQVHDLRTRTRRVESIFQSLDMASSGKERKLLGELKRVRKRAGKVRDMDVLTSHVIGLGLDEDAECVVRLAHHLGVVRYRNARKLHAEVRQHTGRVRDRLQRSRRKLDAAIDGFGKTKLDLGTQAVDAEEAPLHAISEALRLSRELAAVRHLGRDNLHPYRIEVKRLRYILEMAESDGRQQHTLIAELKEVQDLIGEWHDWVQLSGIAHKVLKQHNGCKLLKKIEQTTRRKFEEALRAAERVRQQYLQRQGKTGGRARRWFAPGPVLVAASEIAA